MSELMIVITGVFILLALINTALFLQQWRHPKKNLKEWHQRVKTWWWIFIALTVAFALEHIALLIFLTLVCFIAVVEYVHFFKPQLDRGQLAVLMLSVPCQFIFAYYKILPWFYAFVPTLLFVIFTVQTVLTQNVKVVLQQSSEAFWGATLLVYFLSHLVALMGFHPADGLEMILFVVVLTSLGDTGQYIVGKLCGKHSILKKVSPKKTWEGLIGGCLVTLILGGGIGLYLLKLTVIQGCLLGLLLGIGGFLGDITFSAFKRAKGLTDSGNLLPGHGGIIDRIDSLCFTAPLFFYIINWIR